MHRKFRSLLSALIFMVIGFAVGELAIIDLPARAQQATPAPSDSGAPATDGRSPDQTGGGIRSAARDSAAALAPDVKAALEQVGKKVDAVEQSLSRLAAEARAKTLQFVIWTAVGLVALTFVSSLLGGLVVALMFRRSRAG